MASRDEDVADKITSRGPTPPMHFSSMTLEEEAIAGGWTRITHPVGGEPMRAAVAGMRGEIDMDSDTTLMASEPKSKETGEET